MRESRTRGVDRGTKYFRTMCLKQESLAAGGYEDKVTIRFLCHISHISSAGQPSAQKGLMASAKGSRTLLVLVWVLGVRAGRLLPLPQGLSILSTERLGDLCRVTQLGSHLQGTLSPAPLCQMLMSNAVATWEPGEMCGSHLVHRCSKGSSANCSLYNLA